MHFGSDKSLLRGHRPFGDHRKYADFQIKKWNGQAGNNDIIYHLGDFVNYNDEEKRRLGDCFSSG